MGKLLVCPKNKGNTYKVCAYLKRNTDIDMKIINQENNFELDKYNKIILSTGVYGGDPHAYLKDWIKSLTEEEINNTKFYLFLTWFGVNDTDEKTKEEVDSLLKEKGAKLEDDYLTVYGQKFLIIRFGHPNQEEIKKVSDWVKKL